tara:strand:- start:4279 stop:4545 length:267 start_codon:yes stop_codon:yes gene_type:complete
MRPTHAIIKNKSHALLTRVELEEWSNGVYEFSGNDFRGLLTLMVFYNLFEDFLESDSEILEKYKQFMNETNVHDPANYLVKTDHKITH